MASGLTHILLTKKLQDNIPDGELKNVLAFGSDSLLVGAIKSSAFAWFCVMELRFVKKIST